MKRSFVAAVAVWGLTFGSCAQEKAAPPGAARAAGKPRLVVLCAVDQLATWVFDEGLPHLDERGGFRRLLREGARFPACRYAHACTETGPGHATIGTGVSARVHGIVRNKWWIRDRRATTYCVDEPMAPLADLPEGRNRGPGLLLAPTLAAAMEQADPESRTVSVSWKDRAAVLMAGSRADLAVWCEVGTGRFVTNTAWVEATPEWLTAFNERRVLDQWFGQSWERSGPESAYAGLVDDRPYELPHANGEGRRTLPQPLTGGATKAGSALYTQLYASPFGNTAVRELAEAAVRGMQLGADATTDLLCVSFSSTDVVGHVFGPDSVEARDTLLRLDRELGTFLTFLDTEVGAGQWSLFLTADHGVGPTPEWARERGLDAGRGVIQTMAGAAAERALATRFGPPPSGRRYIAHIGEFSVFFDEAVLAERRGEREIAAMRLEAARLVADVIRPVRGIASAFATEDLLALGANANELEKSLVESLCPGRAGEVQYVIQPYWLDGTTPASHGTPHAYDREVVGLAIGPGVPAGATIAHPISPGFGAVWFARQLGLPAFADATDTVPAAFGAPW